jgi:hypothetical protein
MLIPLNFDGSYCASNEMYNLKNQWNMNNNLQMQTSISDVVH